MTLLLKSFVIQYISSSLFHNPLKFSTMPEPELKKRQCNRLRCSKKCTKKINKQQCPSGFKEILEGKHDGKSEMNFYMVGGIEEVK